MLKTIWYISKYVVPPYAAPSGSRGFYLLSAMADLGCNCHLICSDSNHLAMPPILKAPVLCEDMDGVVVHWLKTRKYRASNSLGRMISWLDFEWRLWRMRKADLPIPDVIIVSSLSLLTVLSGLYLRRRYRCKLVFEVRDIWPLSLQELMNLSRWNPAVLFLGFIERLGYRYADLVVGTMPNLRAHVAEVLGYSRFVGCIPQGFSPLAEAAPKIDPHHQVVPNDKFIVAYTGSIGLANALETLFNAAEILQSRSDIHFLIMGDGGLKQSYMAKYGHLPNVTFADSVPKSMVPAVLRQCDVAYLSTRQSRSWDYGQSLNKVIDYMMSEKIVLASYSGFPSMINEAGCGEFIPAEDVGALVKAIQHYAAMPSAERKRIGQAGKAWLINSRAFSVLAQEYLQMISELDVRRER